MASQEKKQLGMENLETRLNQSVVPMALGGMSVHYAVPVEVVKTASGTVIKLAGWQTALSGPSKNAKGEAQNVVAPPAKKPVLKVPGKKITAAAPVVATPAATTPTVVTSAVTPSWAMRTTPPFVRSVSWGPATSSVQADTTTTPAPKVKTPSTTPSTPSPSVTTPTVVTPTNSTPSVPSTPAADPVAPTTPTSVPTASSPSVTSPAPATSTPSTSTPPSSTTSTTVSNTATSTSSADATTSTTTAPTSTPSTTPSTSTATPTVTPTVAAPDPLASLIAQLHGDGVHDDSGTIQQMVDAAYANGYTNINLPAGTFLLKRQIDLYGTNVTLSGQGDSTVLEVDNRNSGTGILGDAVAIQSTVDATPLMIAQPVTGNTIVFQGNAAVTAGQKLFLSNGYGSTALIEAALHGNDTGPGAFEGAGPCEFVQVTSVSQDANGNTVATLAQSVVGVGQYGNVAASGVSSINYLHASAIDRPADHVTLQNVAIHFKTMYADLSVLVNIADHVTIKNVHVLNQTQVGGLGGIGVDGSMNLVVKNVTGPCSIGLNSTRGALVTNNTVLGIALEESSTDNLITRNTLTGTTGDDFRINDMACTRNTFSYNDVHGGTADTGAIAIAEGTDNTIANNNVHDGVAGIWLGTTSGTEVLNNVANLFANYQPIGDAAVVTGNSWQS